MFFQIAQIWLLEIDVDFFRIVRFETRGIQFWNRTNARKNTIFFTFFWIVLANKFVACVKDSDVAVVFFFPVDIKVKELEEKLHLLLFP